MWLIWLIAGITLLVIEMNTGAFFAVFFGFACLAAAAVSVLLLDSWVQFAVFAASSAVGLLLVRPPVVRFFQRRQSPITPPGAAGLIGQEALTTDDVGDEHHAGHALLGNESWLAYTDGPAPLQPNTRVVVSDVHGTTLVVRALAALDPKPARQPST